MSLFNAASRTTLLKTLSNSLENHSNATLSTQIRNKHSARQVKRLFKNHPARRRVMSRLNAGKIEEEMTIADPKFQPVFSPVGGFLSNGWSAPPSSEEDFVMPKYPFHVERTKNKPNGAVGFLPVYTDYRLGGTKVTTIVRKVTGDTSTFISELAIAIGLPEKQIQESIRVRTGGNIEVNGLHTAPIRKWLAGLGF